MATGPTSAGGRVECDMAITLPDYSRAMGFPFPFPARRRDRRETAWGKRYRSGGR